MTSNETIQCSTEGERYAGLDVLRALGSFGVIFVHVYTAVGQPSSIYWLLKLRDFSLPVLVLSSFFLLTASLSRKPEYGFADFFGRRAKRLWLPMVIWTAIYSLAIAFVLPGVFAVESMGLPPLAVFMTGYRHLWYLQFVFLGSLLIYPLIIFLVRKVKDSAWSSYKSYGALGSCAIFLMFFRLYADWDAIAPEADISVQMFVSQSASYFPLIPWAAAVGLARHRIVSLFTRKTFRILSLAAVLAAAGVHLAMDNVPFTREAFAFAVFFAALQPIRRVQLKRLAPLAGNSYGIYILHFLPVQIVWILVAVKGYGFGGASVLVLTAGIYVGCFALTSALGRLPFAEWFLPTVFTALRRKTATQHEEPIVPAGPPARRLAV